MSCVIYVSCARDVWDVCVKMNVMLIKFCEMLFSIGMYVFRYEAACQGDVNLELFVVKIQYRLRTKSFCGLKFFFPVSTKKNDDYVTIYWIASDSGIKHLRQFDWIKYCNWIKYEINGFKNIWISKAFWRSFVKKI